MGETHRDDPPVAQLTGGVGQDEHGEAEDSQQLHRAVGKTVEKRERENRNKIKSVYLLILTTTTVLSD